MPKIATLQLKPRRDKPVRQGHPWLFSGAVSKEEGPRNAALVKVVSSRGKPLALGFYSPDKRIRARLLAGVEGEELPATFFSSRLSEAQRLRQSLLPTETTGYRLLNAEGDGIPGWTIDRYGDLLVSQITSTGLERLRDEAYDALRDLYPESTIMQKNGGRARRDEGLAKEDEAIFGEVPAEVEFMESGLRFIAEVEAGQKTGFYLDQRPNRRLAENLAGGRRVLDLFAHTGAFSLYALRGGASQIRAIESAARMIERAQQGVTSNQLDPAVVEWRCENVFQALRAEQDTFDLVICDPPPLAPRRSARLSGSRAYKDLNRLAFSRLAPGGLLLTFSCSSAVDSRLFRQILFAAADEAGVRASLIRPLSAGADHPVAITHPEGEYLKGWLVSVSGKS